MGKLQTSDVSSMYNNLKNTTAIIFDIRNYPKSTVWSIADLIYPNHKCFSKFSNPDVTYPGTFFWNYEYLGVDGNPTPYTGKVIILCDENTQSQAEFSCMVLKSMTNSVVVGSQTVGTDGNITFFNLSQDIRTGFTSLGVYYPNGDSTQRIGIVPDSVVYPTAYGIRHGMDEVLEKALEIANCNLSIPDNNNQIQSTVAIYPNPATDQITIEKSSFNIDKEESIYIYDIQGKLLFRKLLQQDRTNINISIFDKGVYIVRVLGVDINVVKKIIKE